MKGDPTRPEPFLVANYHDRSGHLAFYLFARRLFSAPFFALWKSEAARDWLISPDPRIATADWRPILGL